MNLDRWLHNQRTEERKENLMVALKDNWKTLVLSEMFSQNTGRIDIGFLSSFNNREETL